MEIKKILFCFFVLFLVIFNSSFSYAQEKEKPVPEYISCEELYGKIEELRQTDDIFSTVLIDLHPQKYKMEHIPFSIPMNIEDIPLHIDKFKKFEEIILYCHCSNPEYALYGAAAITSFGIDNVKVLKNFERWQADYSMIKNPRSTFPPAYKYFLEKSTDDFVMYDIRDGKKFKKQHISGAENIEYEDLISSETYKDMPSNRVKVIVSSDGIKSGQAVEFLKNKGVSHIFNLPGGILKWIEDGKPVKSD
ncbi:MAG: rhodanese-like domain-containing protein [Elusimicrobiota bacterium]